MLRSYIISALRNLLRNKTQSLIQVFSLAIGLMVFILIAFYLYDAITVDRSNPKLNQVYRLESTGSYLGANDTFSNSGSKAIAELIPEVLTVSQFKTDNLKTSLAILDSNGIQCGQYELEHMMDVDSFFLDVFPQEFIWGNSETALDQPGGNIVLTESVAKGLFGDVNPLGKIVYVWNSHPTTVTGVIRDPVNTHLKFDALKAWDLEYRLKNTGHPSDASALFYDREPTYALLIPEADVSDGKQFKPW